MIGDSTTGDISLMRIYGRKLFFDTAKEMIDKNGTGFYILSCINIDNFKVINAQYGTAVGDRVLMHVAQCLSRCMESIGGICGHIGGDDFVAMFPSTYAASRQLTESYNEASSPDCIYQRIRLRVGRLVVDVPLSSVDVIYDCAKIAADTIRGNYEKNIEYYKEYMQQDLVDRQQIIYEMRDALAGGQFEPWFQPQYNHATGALIGAEVLVRWNKNGEYIPPNEFIPIFEKNGFIYEMDKYIWERACEAIRRRMDEGKKVLPLSVNISRRDILHEDFILVLSALIKKYDICVNMLRLEITETAFAEQSREVAEKVELLTELGFIVEIDDFGSGYSSLNTLKDVPTSILKLDMRFFESTKNSQRAGNIIESVVRMAKWLGMAVIAEGVEEKAQADYLKSIGCYYIQGYYYAKPMPLADYERLLDNSELERELSRLKTLKNLDNNEFWNPKSMDTLIFNSYVGGACIFEYFKGKTDVLRLNDQYIAQFGGIIKEGTALYGAAVSKYMDEQGKKILSSTIDKAIKTRAEASCEVKVSNEGQTEYVRITLRVIARADDRFLFYAAVTNMTEQRVAEINERNMTTQLDTILGSIHASVTAAVFDGDKMKVIFKNNGFYNMYGYTKEQYDNEILHINDLILPEDREKTEEIVREIVSDRKTRTFEFRARKRDGSIVWVQTTNSVVSLDGIGDCVLLGIATDVTYLHMLKNAEEEAADKLRAVLNNVDNGITAEYTNDGDTRFLLANDKFFEIYRDARKYKNKLSAELLTESVHAEDRELVRYNISRDLTPGEKIKFEYRLVRPDGRIVWIKATMSTTNISGIDSPVRITVYSDITEEREHNIQLRFLNESAHEILAQPDCEKAIRHTLGKILDYFAGERAYVIEVDDGGETASNTYEICRPGVSKEIENLQKVPMSVMDSWFSRLRDNRYVTVEDVREIGAENESLMDILEAQNIHSIIIAPLWCDGRLDGFVGVDNPSKRVNHLVHLAALGDYIAVLLTRRDLTAKLASEENQFMDIVNNIPGGFVRLKLNKDGKYVPIHISNGIKELLHMDMAALHRIYGEDILNGVHPDDVASAVKMGGEMIENGATKSGHFRVLNGDGGYSRIMMSGRASRDYKGRVYLNFYYTDVDNDSYSEKKDMELLDSLSCMAAMLEFDGESLSVLHTNGIYRKTVGRTDGKAGKDMLAENRICPEDNDRLMKEIKDAIAENRDAAYTVCLRCDDGAYRRFHAVARIRRRDIDDYILYARYSPAEG